MWLVIGLQTAEPAEKSHFPGSSLSLQGPRIFFSEKEKKIRDSYLIKRENYEARGLKKNRKSLQ